MQLIINCPTYDVGIGEFNNAFAKVQKELVLKSIRDLNIDISSREKVLCILAKMLREQIKRHWITSRFFNLSYFFLLMWWLPSSQRLTDDISTPNKLAKSFLDSLSFCLASIILSHGLSNRNEIYSSLMLILSCMLSSSMIPLISSTFTSFISLFSKWFRVLRWKLSLTPKSVCFISSMER